MNFLKYSLIRFGVMAVVFAACLWMHVGMVFGGIFAVLIGFAVAYLAFPKLHVAAGEDMGRFLRRFRTKHPKKPGVANEDAEVEDSYVDQRLREEDRYV